MVNSITTFYQFREEFPTLSCECGHPVSLHSLNIEFHACLANRCFCRGFSVSSPKRVAISLMPVQAVWRNEDW
jgi:hypothetical protein